MPAVNSPAEKNSETAAESTLELLESIAADRTVLDDWPEAERMRLHQAIASIYHPEPKLRRKKSKELERERHAEKLRRADALLDQTGIRALRRAPVFTTPNYFPPGRTSSPGTAWRKSASHWNRRSCATATCARRNTPWSTTSTTRCARTARSSISSSAPNWPT